jgi:transposase
MKKDFEMAKFEVDLNIPDVKILDIKTTKTRDLVITVKSIKKSTKCHKCSKEIHNIHGYGEAIMLRHLPILGQTVYIQLRPARFRCEDCDGKPTSTEEPSWYNRRSKFTKAYEEWLMKMLINSTVSDVAHKEEISCEDVEGVLNRQIETEIDWGSIETLPYFGLDEIALKKGHKDFVVIVSTRVNDAVKIIAILPDRKKETIRFFLEQIPDRVKKTIISVCSDMYDGYINAVKEVLGKKIKVVIDRFHVAKHYRSGLDKLRKKELKRLKKDLNESDYIKLKGTMWALRKKEKDLTEQDKNILAAVFEYSPNLKQAYDLQNQLTNIFEQNINKGDASKLIEAWIQSVQASGLDCFDKFIDTLRKNWNEILNYFYHRQRKNSGFIEGLNNKIKVIKRRCYGIFNINRLFQRISLDLNGYERFA